MRGSLFQGLLPVFAVAIGAFGQCLPLFANPIAVPFPGPGLEVQEGKYLPSKEWERCLVALQAGSAAVSCAIGYRLRPETRGASKIQFQLPVLLPEGWADNGAAALAKCVPRLEVKGSIVSPSNSELLNVTEGRKTFRTPPGMEVALFSFSVDVGKGESNLAVAFSYHQPFVRRDFVYMPLFEEGRDPPADAEFTLTAFPVAPGLPLTLASRNKSVRAKMQTRVTVNLRHHDLIRITAG